MSTRQYCDDEMAFLAAIHASPRDDGPRLAYAAWLDANGQQAMGDFIRWQIASRVGVHGWIGKGNVRMTHPKWQYADAYLKGVATAPCGLITQWIRPFPKEFKQNLLRSDHPQIVLRRGIPTLNQTWYWNGAVDTFERMYTKFLPHMRLDNLYFPTNAARWTDEILLHPFMLRADSLTFWMGSGAEAVADLIHRLATSPLAYNLSSISFTAGGPQAEHVWEVDDACALAKKLFGSDVEVRWATQNGGIASRTNWPSRKRGEPSPYARVMEEFRQWQQGRRDFPPVDEVR